jgi:hypothetical protein
MRLKSALEDFEVNTLAAVPGLLGKLSYLGHEALENVVAEKFHCSTGLLASRDREARCAAAVAFAFALACAVCLSGYDFQSKDGGCFSVFPSSARTDGAATETPIATASRRAVTGRRLIGS